MIASLTLFVALASFVHLSETIIQQYPFSILRSRTNYGTASNVTGKASRMVVLGLINYLNTPFPHFLYPLPGYLFNGSFTTAREDPESRRCVLEGASYILGLINSNPDFLPGFELEMHYYAQNDESPLSGANILVDFMEDINPKLVNSRWVIGPTTSCESQLTIPVDRTMIAALLHFNMRRFNAYSCSREIGGPVTKMISSQNFNYDYSALALLNFAKTSGHWTQLGVLSGDALTRSSAAFYISQLSRWAATAGIKVVHIAIDSDYYNMFTEIREKSSARIIWMASYAPTCIFCVYVWCTSYRAGIRAPKYIVLLPNVFCSTCLSVKIPKGIKLTSGRAFESCDKSIHVEQARIFLYSGRVDVVKQYSQNENMPYEAFSSYDYLNGIIFNESQLRDAERKARCTRIDQRWGDIVDSLLSVALMMNLTDKALKETFNSSILIESKKIKGGLIADMITQVAAELGFLGTKSKSRLMDMEEYYVLQAGPNSDEENIVTRTGFGNVDPDTYLNFSELNITILNQVKWATSTLKPPKDLSNVLRIRGDVNSLYAFILTAAAIVLTCIQVVVVSASFCNKPSRRARVYYDYTMNGAILTGCLILNTSVVILLVGTVFFLPQLCSWRSFPTIFGLTIVHGGLFSKIEAVPTYINLNRQINSATRHLPDFDLKAFESRRKADFKQMKLNVLKGFSSVIILSLLAILIWFNVDPMSWTYTVAMSDDPLFDEVLDSYYDIKIEYCTSAYQIHSIWTFIMFHFVMLFTGFFVAISVKSRAKHLRKRFAIDVSQTRLATVNAAISFTLFVLLYVLFRNMPPQMAHLQITVIAIGLLWHSASTSAIVLYPFFGYISCVSSSNQVGIAHSNNTRFIKGEMLEMRTLS